MRITNTIQLGLLVAAGVVLGWGMRQHAKQARELASVQAQAETQQGELESRQQALQALEQRNGELEQAERRAGNQTLLSLLRERNAATLASRAGSQIAGESPGLSGALARAIDSPERANQDSRRAEIRADLYQLFKCLNLPREKEAQYVDLRLQRERRMAERLSALLHGTMTVAEAARQRDADEAEYEQQSREVLGDTGMDFLNGIAEGIRKNEAKRLAGIVQDNMAANPLSPEQSERLQALIKVDIIPIRMDDVELFRPPEEWTQYCLECQRKFLTAAADFLTPAQQETLKTIGATVLTNGQQQMAQRRKALGIN
jgi:hypothetical protein